MISTLLDILYPPPCLGCQKSGSIFCTSCASQIPIIKEQLCPICYQPASYGAVCSACSQNTTLDGLIVATPYEYTLIQVLIKQCKYRFAENCTEIFATLIAQAGTDIFNEEACLVAVPLHWWRKCKRGFNQSELVSMHLARKTKSQTCLCLKRTINTLPQAYLSDEQRRKNIRGAFRVSVRSLPQKDFILIDDVASTLSTLNECATVLKAEGARSVWGAVVSRGTLGSKCTYYV